MSQDNYTEMVHFLENVAKVNRAVTLPYLEKKTRLTTLAEEFQLKNPNCPLTKKDYDYKKEILALMQ